MKGSWVGSLCMTLNQLTYSIRGAVYEVYNAFGSGLFESVYEKALFYELTQRGHVVRSQIGIPVAYQKIDLDLGFRLDLIVDDSVIIEIKSVEELHPIHSKQVITYLKLTGVRLGLLINFNSDPIKIVRLIKD